MMQARLVHEPAGPDLPPFPSTSLLMLAAAAVADPARTARRDGMALRLYRAFQLEHVASWSRDELLAALGCLELVDGIARRWAQAHRTGRVVEVGAPLSTRHLRLGGDAHLYTSVDDPQGTAVRAAVLDGAPLHQMVARPGDRSWIARLGGEGRPLLVLVPEQLLDEEAARVAARLADLGDALPAGAELVCVHGAHAAALRSVDGAVVVGGDRGVAHATSSRLGWAGPPPRAPRPRELAVAHLTVA